MTALDNHLDAYSPPPCSNPRSPASTPCSTPGPSRSSARPRSSRSGCSRPRPSRGSPPTSTRTSPASARCRSPTTPAVRASGCWWRRWRGRACAAAAAWATRCRRRWRLAYEHRKHAVVLANGCEGDPSSAKDRALLRRAPHLVLDGIALAAHAIGAREAVLALHTGSPLTAVLANALAERAGDPVDVELAEMPAGFVSSESTALVNTLNTGDPRPTGVRTSKKGMHGRPTLVSNVETLAHLALIARFGDDSVSRRGHPELPRHHPRQRRAARSTAPACTRSSWACRSPTCWSSRAARPSRCAPCSSAGSAGAGCRSPTRWSCRSPTRPAPTWASSWAWPRWWRCPRGPAASPRPRPCCATSPTRARARRSVPLRAARDHRRLRRAGHGRGRPRPPAPPAAAPRRHPRAGRLLTPRRRRAARRERAAHVRRRRGRAPRGHLRAATVLGPWTPLEHRS